MLYDFHENNIVPSASLPSGYNQAGYLVLFQIFDESQKEEATGQLKAQEKLLFRKITLYERLIGIDTEDYFRTIMNLTKNHCLQKKSGEFRQLMQKYDLKYIC